jgi:hypothetical protein
MLPTKPSHFYSFLLAFLTIFLFQFFPQKPPPAKPPNLEPRVQTPAPEIIQAQTGRSEVLEAIVPLERMNRAQSSWQAPAQQKPPTSLVEAEGLEFPPTVQKFIDEIADGEADAVRGVYVADTIMLPVIQQPKNNAAFVSEEAEVITQFQSAAQYGVIGLLAHNFLSGELFYNLGIGQEVVIVMGDGSNRRYLVEGVYQYKKLSPNNLRSNLVDLSDGQTLTTSQVFSRFYRGDHKVTFQTCLEREGKLNWGLTFIVALPLGSDN